MHGDVFSRLKSHFSNRTMSHKQNDEAYLYHDKCMAYQLELPQGHTRLSQSVPSTTDNHNIVLQYSTTIQQLAKNNKLRCAFTFDLFRGAHLLQSYFEGLIYFRLIYGGQGWTFSRMLTLQHFLTYVNPSALDDTLTCSIRFEPVKHIITYVVQFTSELRENRYVDYEQMLNFYECIVLLVKSQIIS